VARGALFGARAALDLGAGSAFAASTSVAALAAGAGSTSIAARFARSRPVQLTNLRVPSSGWHVGQKIAS